MYVWDRAYAEELHDEFRINVVLHEKLHGASEELHDASETSRAAAFFAAAFSAFFFSLSSFKRL